MAKKENIEKLPTTAQVEKYEMLSPMLDSILSEMREFSKKKQDEVLNKLKVNKMINKILEQMKDLLSEEPTIDFLDLIDDATLPTNSDAVLIISQYRAALNQFKNTYYGRDESTHRDRWFTKENPKDKWKY